MKQIQKYLLNSYVIKKYQCFLLTIFLSKLIFLSSNLFKTVLSFKFYHLFNFHTFLFQNWHSYEKVIFWTFDNFTVVSYITANFDPNLDPNQLFKDLLNVLKEDQAFRTSNKWFQMLRLNTLTLLPPYVNL